MRRRDHDKKVTGLVLDPELAFPAITGIIEIGAFCDAAEEVTLASDRFFGLPDAVPEANWEDEFVRFPSSISTGICGNDIVHSKVTRSKATDQAVLVFHHWNALSRNAQLARFFAKRGICVFEIAMPYHLERSRPGATYADHMLSPNLGRTIQSIRQAVVDGRQLIRILQRAGYRKVSVMGISLGSWVAGLVAAHDSVVERASLFLTAGDLAEMVWTGGATRHIRASLEGRIGLSELRRAWAPLNLENHAARLARPGLDLQILLAKRDRVVMPALSERLVQRLEVAAAAPNVVRLNCGHYSLTLPPYVLSSGMNASQFLRG